MKLRTISGFLHEMAVLSRARADRLHASDLRARAADAAPAPRFARTGFDLVAEIKLSSPSEGALAAGLDVAERARTYARAGAAAISVLTEESRFGGKLAHLAAAADAARTCGVPAMRKDFLVDPLQVVEARACGAGGVLLVARIVSDEALTEMLDTARALGLFVLLEAFDEEDLERISAQLATSGGAPADLLVGVNARDLATLQVDAKRQLTLAARLPAAFAGVAESGILGPEDAANAARAGFDAVLVGTALMRADDPAVLARELLQAGRAATSPRRVELFP